MKPLIFSICVLSLTFASCSKRSSEAAPTGEFTAIGIEHSLLVEPRLASSGQPDEAQFAQLPAAGFTHVICLRPENEPGTGWEEARAKELGIDFVRIPVAGPGGLDEATARKLDQALSTAGDAKTLISCSTGNRVGGLLALRAYHVKGETAEDALAYGKSAGLTTAEPAVRAQLRLPAGN